MNIEFVAKGWEGCTGKTTDDCRPMLVKLVSSSGITVRDVTLTASAFWTFHLLNCSYTALHSRHLPPRLLTPPPTFALSLQRRRS